MLQFNRRQTFTSTRITFEPVTYRLGSDFIFILSFAHFLAESGLHRYSVYNWRRLEKNSLAVASMNYRWLNLISFSLAGVSSHVIDRLRVESGLFTSMTANVGDL